MGHNWRSIVLIVQKKVSAGRFRADCVNLRSLLEVAPQKLEPNPTQQEQEEQEEENFAKPVVDIAAPV